MSHIKCSECGFEFNGNKTPFCPKCLAAKWKATPNFIREKHDPKFLPKAEPSFRSVLSWEFINNQDEFLEYTTCSGTWYFSKRHNKYCHFTDTRIFDIPGSGTLAGSPMPDHALNGILVADADKNAHAYAVDISDFSAEIASGDYIPLHKCNHPGCDNLVHPGRDKCILHIT